MSYRKFFLLLTAICGILMLVNRMYIPTSNSPDLFWTIRFSVIVGAMIINLLVALMVPRHWKMI